jgi:hypothetical protein
MDICFIVAGSQKKKRGKRPPRGGLRLLAYRCSAWEPRAERLTDEKQDRVTDRRLCLLNSVDGRLQAFAAVGYLANSGSPVPIKGTYFFTGDAKPDRSLYTFMPVDARHLHWQTDKYAPGFVVDTMESVGINVVVMSYWGFDQINSAPMQSTEEAGDLLFDAAIGRHISILPLLK